MALAQSLQSAAMQAPVAGIACAAATRYAFTRLRSNPRVRGALGSVLARGKAIASSAVLQGSLEDYKTLKKGVTYATPTKDPNEKLVEVKVNGKAVKLKADVSRPNGEQGLPTVLEACKLAGENVPTLCYHPALKTTQHSATCRLCLVEVSETPGQKGWLKPACTTKLREGMEIVTNSDEVQHSVKKDLELLRARHPNACMNCDVNGRCEFQNLMYKYDIAHDPFGKEPRADFEPDYSSNSIHRDMDKCVMCQRCVAVCDQAQDMNILGPIGRGGHMNIRTYNGGPLNSTDCINCGQCAVVCPVGAITEADHVHEVMEHLRTKKKIMVVQNAPATRVTVSEDFDMEPGWISPLQLVSAMRTLGFDHVFDTNFAADLTTMEEANEFLRRLKAGGPFPMFTSCCPGWVNLVEKQYPQYTNNLSTCKSPMGMLGSVIKNIWAQRLGVSPEDICSVAIMPCTAKKDEISRRQLQHPSGKSRLDVADVPGPNPHVPDFEGERSPDIDYVLTTRELAHMLRIAQVPVFALPESEYDNPLGLSTGAGEIFGVTGGVMESALRTAYEAVTGKKLEKIDFDQVRGLEGVRDANITLPLPTGGDVTVRVAMAHGTRNVKILLDKIEKKEAEYDFIEIMACHGGCVGGGGNPKSHFADYLHRRTKAVYDLDQKAALRKAQDNPDIQKLYDEVLKEPGSHAAEKLLHTYYTDRSHKE